MNRDDALRAMRPAILAEPAAPDTPLAFQNEVLRPLLKLQHGLLLAVTAERLRRVHPRFPHFDPAEQARHLTHLLQHDGQVQRLLEGCILGVMTAPEVATYLADRPSYQRRLAQLLGTRLQSDLAGLSALVARDQS